MGTITSYIAPSTTTIVRTVTLTWASSIITSYITTTSISTQTPSTTDDGGAFTTVFLPQQNPGLYMTIINNNLVVTSGGINVGKPFTLSNGRFIDGNSAYGPLIASLQVAATPAPISPVAVADLASSTVALATFMVDGGNLTYENAQYLGDVAGKQAVFCTIGGDANGGLYVTRSTEGPISTGGCTPIAVVTKLVEA